MRNQISASLTIDASALAAVIRSEIAPMFEQLKASLSPLAHPTPEHVPVTDAPVYSEHDGRYIAECTCGVYFDGALKAAEDALAEHLAPNINVTATHAPLSAATYITDEGAVELLTDCGLDALQASSLLQKLHNNGAAIVRVSQS